MTTLDKQAYDKGTCSTRTSPRAGRGTKQGTKLMSMRGAVAVEFALLLIPLMLLAFGIAEYGRALYQYNTLVKTVRDAARLLSHYNPEDPASYGPVLEEARCLAVYGNTSCSGPALAPGLTTGMVTIASSATTTAAGTTVTLVEVRITGYVFNFVFNPARLLGAAADTIPFSDIHATMRQL
ncbi:TadE-like protein [Nitrosospira multiformis]|uniref:TadE-like protein n=2 Tax=Nitrosospira multiformis TaxID=1231 RepID=A0A1I0CAW6_9PROT|nr:TadE-like protein [Nitrosospira multiformis]